MENNSCDDQDTNTFAAAKKIRCMNLKTKHFAEFMKKFFHLIYKKSTVISSFSLRNLTILDKSSVL